MTDQEKSDFINLWYLDKKKSFQEIAIMSNTYANKIRRDAKKFNIPIRDKSEAQKNALSTGSHVHPTKGKTRSSDTKLKIGYGVMKNWENLSEAELSNRKEKAKEQWQKLDENEKANLVKLANEAVRNSSKAGSKLEKFILKELINLGYQVDFHKEQTLVNTKLQIDLFIPKHNIAIEVDGPSHFMPVWGEDVLKRNIKYDNKKTGLLLGKGCVLIRIKQTKDYSPTRARLICDNLIQHLKKIHIKFPDIDNRIIEIGD